MTNDLSWRKSSYSGGSGGNCVELTDHAGRVLVRDSQDQSGPVLKVPAEAWARFAAKLKAS
jgi:hypothetical protein